MHNFDLSKSMGDLLIDNFDFSNVEIIRAVFKCIMDCEELNKALKNEVIWELYQTRNLIIHRGAIIDSRFLSQTKIQSNLGDKHYIKPEQLSVFLEHVVQIGTCFKKYLA